MFVNIILSFHDNISSNVCVDYIQYSISLVFYIFKILFMSVLNSFCHVGVAYVVLYFLIKIQFIKSVSYHKTLPDTD